MGQSSSIYGPLSIIGQNPTLGPGPTPYLGGAAAVVDSNPDLAPSLIYGGFGIRDPRYLPRIGAGALGPGGYPNQDCGWYMSAGGLVLTDQAPSAVSTTNLAIGQHTTSGTLLSLVTASGAGITVLAAPLTILPTGIVIPAGALVVDAATGYVGGGTSGAFQFFDPTKGVARCLSITAAAGATGTTILLRGADIYGVPISQLVTVSAGATVNTTKAFKYLFSATPNFTDSSHNYSIGTADVYGFNIYVPKIAYAKILWNNALITASAGFTAGVTTAPTNLTGDVRGTYAIQADTSDGTKVLNLFAAPSVASMVAQSLAAATTGLIGTPQA